MVGIYKITNKINNKFYIGSSKNIANRWKDHLSGLSSGNHSNYKLQNAINEFGIQNFTFEIIEVITTKYDRKYLLTREQYYLDKEKSYLDDIGYNINDKTICIDNIYDIVMNNDLLETVLSDVNKKYLKENLSILNNNKDKIINKYNDKHALSTNWFIKNRSELKNLKNDIFNYYFNRIHATAKTFYWTCNSNWYNDLFSVKVKHNWIGYNPNNVKDRRNNLAFIMNVFPNEFVVRKLNIDYLDKDLYALCVIVNWICSVADITKPINIYVPSKRMRDILLNWINS